MKKLWLVLLAAWIGVLPLYAAMSDAQALKQARLLFGPQAEIATVRDLNAQNWTKQIGVKSLGCFQPFTILGSGFNTWDAAFADYVLHPVAIGGPFKGTVNFKSSVWDDVAVTKFDLIIDSERLNAVITIPPAPRWDLAIPVNTTLLTNTMHVVCKRAEDAAGNVGLSLKVWLFNVDQSIAQGPTEWQLGAPDGSHPSIDVPAGLVSAEPPSLWIKFLQFLGARKLSL